MSELLPVRGIELRYLLTTHLFDHGPANIEELIEALRYQGFDTSGRASKSVSDALRWEMGCGRVIRLGRGRYAPARMPRATEYRIDQRVKALHAKVAALSLRGGQAQALNFPAA
jgi:hypothetical protein